MANNVRRMKTIIHTAWCGSEHTMLNETRPFATG